MADAHGKEEWEGRGNWPHSLKLKTNLMKAICKARMNKPKRHKNLDNY